MAEKIEMSSRLFQGQNLKSIILSREIWAIIQKGMDDNKKDVALNYYKMVEDSVRE